MQHVGGHEQRRIDDNRELGSTALSALSVSN